ncbi:beta-ketoacyl synthase N-terminal-like domain-containing protein [Catenuloplanes indicus]|uniref:3-oxoacyl-[acyl-carrier-protein] synthase II n=1 Tax=Catenuloplanes indicus TaxID=137267 RepID=A0AAE3VTZ3_9ACTN|nr:beta-ketoacyl synthase N-terminal-like domain-containing protein [Catenuloplanes indicus]MDQ0363893.1 3-oxoacyl-[acyl-carrier-protein] synthase II [Catenuloplanes indicus]
MTYRLVLSGWSAVSPFGVGAAAFADGLAAGRTAIAALDPGSWPGPARTGAVIPGFDVVGRLGRKGTRAMDRVTAIAITAVGELLGPEPAGPDTALVLGTGTGSVQSIMDFTRDALTGDKPYLVDPARFPNTVMNRAAGTSAIWHGIRGPNTTIAGGALTGLLALGYAARLLRAGRCTRALCGAAEEYSAQRAWIEHTGAAPGVTPGPAGEGAAVFRLEPAETAGHALAEVAGLRFGATRPGGTAREALERCVTALLADSGVKASEIRAVSVSAPPGPLGDQERAAVRAICDGDVTPGAAHRALLGDTAAAAGAFQIAEVLAGPAARPGEAALVTAVDRDGRVGCLLLRLTTDR